MRPEPTGVPLIVLFGCRLRGKGLGHHGRQYIAELLGVLRRYGRAHLDEAVGLTIGVVAGMADLDIAPQKPIAERFG